MCVCVCVVRLGCWEWQVATALCPWWRGIIVIIMIIMGFGHARAVQWGWPHLPASIHIHLASPNKYLSVRVGERFVRLDNSCRFGQRRAGGVLGAGRPSGVSGPQHSRSTRNSRVQPQSLSLRSSVRSTRLLWSLRRDLKLCSEIDQISVRVIIVN